MNALMTLVLVSVPALSKSQAQPSVDGSGASAPSSFGVAVAVIGDLDGDRVPDFVVSDPPVGARVFSGAEGVLLQLIEGPSAAQRFGFGIAAIGDLDGDGLQEVTIAGSEGEEHPCGFVQVHSLAREKVLFRIDAGRQDRTFGHACAGLSDVNADGVPDFGVSARGKRRLPDRIRVFSGVDGALLNIISEKNETYGFGDWIYGPGDLDADGHADLLVRTQSAHSGGPEVGWVYSGRTGAELYGLPYDFNHTESTKDTAVKADAMAVIGDLNWDGAREIAVGKGRHVDVYSGRTGDHYLRVTLPSATVLAIAGAGDLDEDGAPDLLVSYDPWLAGAVVWVSGRTGRVHKTLASKGDVRLLTRLRGLEGGPDDWLASTWWNSPRRYATGVHRLAGSDGRTRYTLAPE